MNATEIIAKLKENESALRAQGVLHAALFGSRARDEADTESHVDIMVEFDPAARVTVYGYAGVKEYIAALLAEPIDVIDRDAMKPRVRERATKDTVYAF